MTALLEYFDLFTDRVTIKMSWQHWPRYSVVIFYWTIEQQTFYQGTCLGYRNGSYATVPINGKVKLEVYVNI